MVDTVCIYYIYCAYELLVYDLSCKHIRLDVSQHVFMWYVR